MKFLQTPPVENDQEIPNLQSELDFVVMARNDGRFKLWVRSGASEARRRAGFAWRKGFFAVTWSFGSLLAGIQAGGGAGAIQGCERLREIGNSQGAFGGAVERRQTTTLKGREKCAAHGSFCCNSVLWVPSGWHLSGQSWSDGPGGRTVRDGLCAAGTGCGLQV